MAQELFANDAFATVTAGAVATSGGSVTETWTISTPSNIPVASNAATPPTQFRACDRANPGEIFLVTNVSGAGATWAVTRAAESVSSGAPACISHPMPFVVDVIATAVNLAEPASAAETARATAAEGTLTINVAANAGAIAARVPLVNPAESYVAGAAPANTRRATQAFNDTAFATTTSYQDTNLRFAFSLPVNVTRVRFKWSNNGLAWSARAAGQVGISGVWMGPANVATATKWGDDFISAPVQVGNAATTNPQNIAITGATAGTPTTIHSVAHGLTTGQQVLVSLNVFNGITGANSSAAYTVTVTGANDFTIPVTTTGTWTTGGTWINAVDDYVTGWTSIASLPGFAANTLMAVSIGINCGRTITDGQVTSGGSVLTSPAQGAFTSADIGRTLAVTGSAITGSATVTGFTATTLTIGGTFGTTIASAATASIATAVYYGGSSCATTNGAGCSLAANAGAAGWNAAGGAQLTNTPLGDLRMEYEYVGSNQIGLYVGDSIMAGWASSAYQAAGFASASAGAVGPFNRYVEKAGLRLGHATINAGVGTEAIVTPPSGFPTNSLQTPSAMYWNRFDLATTIPDYSFIALGTNDLATFDNTAAMKSSFLTLVALIKSFGINRVFASTIPPFLPSGSVARPLNTATVGGTSATLVVDDTSAANWVIPAGSSTASAATVVSGANFTGTQTFPVTLGTSYAAGPGYVAVGTFGVLKYMSVSGNNLLNCTLVSGAGGTCVVATTTVVGVLFAAVELGGLNNPLYEKLFISSAALLNQSVTLTLAAGARTVSSHLAGALVMTNQEVNRQEYNGWLRAHPPAIHGVFDMALHMEGMTYGGSMWGNQTAAKGSVLSASADLHISQHPYWSPVGSTDAHPSGPSYHSIVSNYISMFMAGQ